MNCLRLVLALSAVSPVLCLAQSKEIRELQRDMAALQQDMRTLQRSLDENMAGLRVLIQQALADIQKSNTSMAVMENGVGQRLRDLDKTLTQPLAIQGAKIDQMANEFQALRDSLADINGRMGKLEQRILDLTNTMKVIQSPPAPPAAGSAGELPPGVSAAGLYASARKDMDGGNYDLALQEFGEYLKFFGNTETAPNAQFYIGEIYFRRGEYDRALQAFDLVLEKYPENTKTLDAMFMKGQTLVRMGQPTRGAEEFREIHRRAPTSEVATRARARLKELGLPLTTTTRKAKKAK